VWLSTSSQDVLTAALEAGISTVLFEDSQAGLASEWQQLGRFDAVRLDAAGRLLADGGIEVGNLLPADEHVESNGWLVRVEHAKQYALLKHQKQHSLLAADWAGTPAVVPRRPSSG
jgi:hypothetical protein